MNDDLTDIKVTLARVTTVMENLNKIVDRHERIYEDLDKAMNENSRDISKIKFLGSVLSFLGLGGLAALIKGGSN